MDWFFVIIVGAIIFSRLALPYFQKKAIEKSWGEFAQKSGLTLISASLFSTPKVTGKYKGFDYELYASKSTFEKKTRTVIEIFFPQFLDCHLHLYRESIFTMKLENVFTGKDRDLKTGDTVFDKSFKIESNIPQKIGNLLTREVREKLLCKKDFITDISISGNGVHYERVAQDDIFSGTGISGTGIIGDISLLEYLSDTLLELVKNACEMESLPVDRKQLTDSSIHVSELSSSNSSEEEKICYSCGASVPAITQFCINCGKKM